MKAYYEQMQSILQRVGFERIYPGFHYYPFALYNESEAVIEGTVMPKPETFRGNTMTEWDGRTIAIWKLETWNRQDPESFAADLVHEMFHAFQKDHNMFEGAPDDLQMLLYPDLAENHRLRYAECRLIRDAFLSTDAEEKRCLYDAAMTVREQRRKLIGDMLAQEERTEYLEGAAECAGCLALKQLNPDKYVKRTAEYAERICRLDREYFDIRRRCYFTGALLRLTERSLDTVKTEGFALTDSYITDRQKRIDAFFAENRQYTEGSFRVCGYDPMNQIRVGDRLLATRFLMLWDGEKMITLNGPTVLRMKTGETRDAEGYWR